MSLGHCLLNQNKKLLNKIISLLLLQVFDLYFLNYNKFYGLL